MSLPVTYRFTSAPTSSDDGSKAFRAGDYWINTSTHYTYLCEDATPGAAVWNQANLVSNTTLSGGASGTAGTINVYPTTAAKGKLSITKSDNSTDSTTTINVAAQALARTLTVPDGGQSTASFVLTEGANTLNDAGADVDTVIEGDTATKLFVCDAGLDAVQVGGTTAGELLDIRATQIVVNEGSADMDIRVESNALANFLVLDSSACLNGELSIGAGIPTNPQAMLALLPPANATGVTANQSYFHGQVLPGGAVTIPAGTAPVVASLNVHEPNITATGTVTDATTVRVVDAPTEGTNNYALWVDAGATRLDGNINWGGAPGGAATLVKMVASKTGIADNTATDILTITVPNANHAACIKLRLMSSNGSTDAFESTRCAEGLIVLTRITGDVVVAVAATLDLTQIATDATGGAATHTLAYGVSAITGTGAQSNTFTIQVTINDSGNTGSNTLVFVAELLNSQATGVTMATA